MTNYNEIYKEQNLIDFPEDVKNRIDIFLNIFNIFKQQGNIVDFGCGNGYIADKCNADKYDFYPSNVNVNYIDLTNINTFPTHKYNNIILTHVLEHFQLIDLKQVILNLRQTLTDNGLIFFSVPNAKYINSNYKPFDFTIGHYIPLTVDLITQLFGEDNIQYIIENNKFNQFEEIIVITK